MVRLPRNCWPSCELIGEAVRGHVSPHQAGEAGGRDRCPPHLPGRQPAELLSSALVITELGRVGLAYGLPAASIATVLQQLDTVRVTDDILGAAGRLPAAPGRVLRTLDAIHVASALTVGYNTVLTHDKPMTDAAAHHGLTVVAPR